MLTLFLLLSVTNGELLVADVCSKNFCNSTHSSQSEVKNFCKNETEKSQMKGRCCVSDETDAVIGIDLSSCGIDSFKISRTNYTDVLMLDLRDNELKNLLPQDLIGLTNLTYLYLPYWIQCPGGSEAWNETEFNKTYCYLQKDPCQYLNISCTDNGNCIHTGPGSAKCICKPDHFGYKCMVEGEFPAVTFSVSVTVTAVILSVVLWFAEGRDAYKKR